MTGRSVSLCWKCAKKVFSPLGDWRYSAIGTRWLLSDGHGRKCEWCGEEAQAVFLELGVSENPVLCWQCLQQVLSAGGKLWQGGKMLRLGERCKFWVVSAAECGVERACSVCGGTGAVVLIE